MALKYTNCKIRLIANIKEDEYVGRKTGSF